MFSLQTMVFRRKEREINGVFEFYIGQSRLLGVWGITRTGPVSLFVEDSPFPLTIHHLEFEPHYVPTPYSGRKTEGGRVVGFATYFPEQGIAYIRQGERSIF